MFHIVIILLLVCPIILHTWNRRQGIRFHDGHDLFTLGYMLGLAAYAVGVGLEHALRPHDRPMLGWPYGLAIFFLGTVNLTYAFGGRTIKRTEENGYEDTFR